MLSVFSRTLSSHLNQSSGSLNAILRRGSLRNYKEKREGFARGRISLDKSLLWNEYRVSLMFRTWSIERERRGEGEERDLERDLTRKARHTVDLAPARKPAGERTCPGSTPAGERTCPVGESECPAARIAFQVGGRRKKVGAFWGKRRGGEKPRLET